jgi:hypothetical protein
MPPVMSVYWLPGTLRNASSMRAWKERFCALVCDGRESKVALAMMSFSLKLRLRTRATGERVARLQRAQQVVDDQLRLAGLGGVGARGIDQHVDGIAVVARIAAAPTRKASTASSFLSMGALHVDVDVIGCLR